MSTATVHRRKLATTGAAPSGASAAKPRSRSRRPSIIGDPRSTVPVRSQGAEQPTRAVRAASLHPRPAAAGNFVPDPVTLGLTERAERPMLTPSLHAFRAYASNHPEFSELKARGLLPMMRAHQGLRLAIFGVAAALVLLLVALLVYWWLLPAPAAADSPYATADGAPQGTAVIGGGRYSALLYQNGLWPDVPYGRATLASTGLLRGAGHGLRGATGDTGTPPSRSPNGPPITMTAADQHRRLVPQQAGSAFALPVEPVELTRRRCGAPSSRMPLLVVRSPAPSRRQPRWWCSTTSTRTPASCCTTRRARAARPRARPSTTSPTPRAHFHGA
ncbi:MAG: hypothetical protein ACLUW6_10465 [Coriobacteriaceae bacterium]